MIPFSACSDDASKVLAMILVELGLSYLEFMMAVLESAQPESGYLGHVPTYTEHWQRYACFWVSLPNAVHNIVVGPVLHRKLLEANKNQCVCWMYRTNWIDWRINYWSVNLAYVGRLLILVSLPDYCHHLWKCVVSSQLTACEDRHGTEIHRMKIQDLALTVNTCFRACWSSWRPHVTQISFFIY